MFPTAFVIVFLGLGLDIVVLEVYSSSHRQQYQPHSVNY